MVDINKQEYAVWNCYLRVIRSEWLTQLGHSLCQGILELNYKCKHGAKQKTNKKTKPKEAEFKKDYKIPTLNKPLYENCYLLGPDDSILATVKKEKLDWYVRKNLGWLNYSVSLLFKLLALIVFLLTLIGNVYML